MWVVVVALIVVHPTEFQSRWILLIVPAGGLSRRVVAFETFYRRLLQPVVAPAAAPLASILLPWTPVLLMWSLLGQEAGLPALDNMITRGRMCDNERKTTTQYFGCTTILLVRLLAHVVASAVTFMAPTMITSRDSPVVHTAVVSKTFRRELPTIFTPSLLCINFLHSSSSSKATHKFHNQCSEYSTAFRVSLNKNALAYTNKVRFRLFTVVSRFISEFLPEESRLFFC